MAGRGPQTFKKRQKEQQRKEKQQEKLARRLQRKEDKANGIETPDDEPETDDSYLDRPLVFADDLDNPSSRGTS